MIGTVKFFLNKKGWGFIIGSDKEEYLVHYNNLINITPGSSFKKLKTGQTVEFEILTTTRGKQAINVQPMI